MLKIINKYQHSASVLKRQLLKFKTMDKINMLNKVGLLTAEDRKAPLQHGCDYFTFETCLDLSQPIKVIPYGEPTEVSLQVYSKDLASFICWWTNFVLKDLNGFSGFSNVKFEPVGFIVV